MTPDHTRYELAPGLWLDARRAVFLAETRTLALADLHLGFAWAHRHAGQLMPITAHDDTRERLLALIDDYTPHEVVLLGDIVHRALPLPVIRDEVRAVCDAIAARASLRLVAGNHDLHLGNLVSRNLLPSWEAGAHLLLHGDGNDDGVAARRLDATRERGGRVIFGHEHPAISLSGGIGTRAKCACFLAAPDALVLPAFSPWAAGTSASGPFISALARLARFDRALAIVAGKLLPVPL